MSEGNSLGAIKDFTSALALEPDNAEALLGRGSVHAEVLDYESALADLNKAAGLDPKLALVYFNLGYVYFQMEKYSQSLDAYNLCLELKPDEASCYMARGEVKLHLGEIEAAKVDFRKFVQSPTAEEEELLSKSKAWLLLDEPEESLKAINSYIQIQPEASRAFLQRAHLYASVFEDYVKAISDYNVYLLKFPDSKEGYEGRGNVYFEMDNMTAAVHDYSRAIDLDNNDPDLYMDRGYAYLVLESPEQSLADFDKAISLNVEDSETAYFNKGIAEFKLGNTAAACESWKKAGNMANEQIGAFCNE